MPVKASVKFTVKPLSEEVNPATGLSSVVINCAAYNAVDLAEIEESTALDINANGPKLLAQACFIRRIKLIHISTDFVFDGELIHPYTEQDVPLPLSVYGGSKLKGESWVNEILGSNAIIICKMSCRLNNLIPGFVPYRQRYKVAK